MRYEQSYKKISKPNLPIGDVRHCIVSPLYKSVIDDLESYGIIPIATPYCNDIQPQVAYHADMVCCNLHQGYIFCDSCIGDLSLLRLLGFVVVCDGGKLSPSYPKDVLYNAVVIGDKLICNVNTIHAGLLNNAEHLGLKILHCNQGYTKCSTAIVDENSIITSDSSVAKVALSAGIEVLVISQGDIFLEGYSYGFIGGCCSKICSNKIYFTGKLESHPNSKLIIDFINSRGVKVVEGSSDKLLDIGSIVPLTESI